MRKLGLCKTTGKIMHYTPTQAEMHIRKLEIRAELTRRHQGGMSYYRCEHCSQYHVGHKSIANKRYTLNLGSGR